MMVVMTMKPADVLQRHVDLTEYIQASTLRDLMVNLGRYANGYTDAEGHDIVNVLTKGLKMAETYVVEPVMMPEIMACSANEIDDSLPFGEQVAPPSPYGFLYFPDPIRHVERRSRNQFIHVLVWCATRDRHDDHGFSMAMFNDVRREPDEIMLGELSDHQITELISRAGGFSPVGLTVIGNSGKLGPYRIYCTPEERKMVRDDGDTPTAYTINMSHVVLATWKLMGETIDYGESTTETPERAAARRAKRAGVKPEVTVINLRRLRHRTKNPGTGKPLEWRQTIPGHWRNQAYGPGRKLRRRIWIDEFEQGPEDAPQRPTKRKVTRLTR